MPPSRLAPPISSKPTYLFSIVHTMAHGAAGQAEDQYESDRRDELARRRWPHLLDQGMIAMMAGWLPKLRRAMREVQRCGKGCAG